MTFEEWYDLLVEWTGYEPAQSAKALAKAAWEAGYVAGMKDVPTAEYEPPKGYVIVPVEPTEAMVEAGEECEYFEGEQEATCADLWEAMIQAAQEEE